MGQLITDLPNNFTPTVVTIQTLPRGRTLTDSSGDALTLANSQSKNQSLYKINCTGAETVYFYSDLTGKETYKLLGFAVSVDAAVTLEGTLQFYRDGDWVDSSVYDFSLDATTAQEMNGVYPLEQGIYGMPTRVKCTTGGACNVYCQMLEG